MISSNAHFDGGAVTSVGGGLQEIQKQIDEHPALHYDITKEGAERLLQGSRSFTFLFRRGEERNSFIISFVQQYCSVCHKVFYLDPQKVWIYKNDYNHIEARILALIPQMMHCDSDLCVPFTGGVQS